MNKIKKTDSEIIFGKTEKSEEKNDELVVVREKISGMKHMIETTEVKTDEDLAAVSDKIKNVKMLLKVIETKKDKFTAPAKLIIVEARDTYDPLIKECKNAEIVLKGKAGKYMLDRDSKRLVEEKRIADKVESGYIKPETAMKKIESLPEVKNTISTDKNSSLRMAKRKVAQIITPDLIPDEYWVIDEVRVRREALEREKNGLPQIPGVVIKEEASLSSF